LLPLSLEQGRPRQKDDLDENAQAKQASRGDSKGKTDVCDDHDHHYQGLNIPLLNKTNRFIKINIVPPMDLVHQAVQSIVIFEVSFFRHDG
jgi:hypothetical protein